MEALVAVFLPREMQKTVKKVAQKVTEVLNKRQVSLSVTLSQKVDESYDSMAMH
jgi:hypothetical protein